MKIINKMKWENVEMVYDKKVKFVVKNVIGYDSLNKIVLLICTDKGESKRTFDINKLRFANPHKANEDDSGWKESKRAIQIKAEYKDQSQGH